MREEILSGELSVIGKNLFQVELKKSLPHSVLVEFLDHPHHIPCHPHHDKLEWEVHDRHHGFVLVIKWDVHSVRQIFYVVSFS